jgi:hypothetical protein
MADTTQHTRAFAIRTFAEHLDAFAEWLVTKGGQILPSTNTYEVIRYVKNTRTQIVYRRDNGQLTFSGLSLKDYNDFIIDAGVIAGGKLDRLKSSAVTRLRALLLQRDGNVCVYCGQFMEAPTIEHFHAIGKNGSNHPDNCALAHVSCNALAADKPIVDKIALRDRIQTAVVETPPWDFYDVRKLA